MNPLDLSHTLNGFSKVEALRRDEALWKSLASAVLPRKAQLLPNQVATYVNAFSKVALVSDDRLLWEALSEAAVASRGQMKSRDVSNSVKSMRAFGPGGFGALVVLLPLYYACGLSLALSGPWALAGRARNRAIHALNGNGRGGKRGNTRRADGPHQRGEPSGFAQVAGHGPGDRFRRNAAQPTTRMAPDDQRGRGHRPPESGSGPSPGATRAAVAARAALKSELEDAGYTVKLPLGDSDLLHLHRRRLTAEDRGVLVKAVGASHIVGDDDLCPSTHRGGVMVGDLWKVAPKFQWATSAHPLPLVVLPDHLTRLQDRIEHELETNPEAKGVVVAVTVPRAVADASADWASFSAKADRALTSSWPASLGIFSVTVFAVPPALLHYPSNEISVPPAKWEEQPLPLRQALVALTIVRQSAAPVAPTFLKVGQFRSWTDIQAAERAGVTRLGLEVDLVQRPQGGRTTQAFARRALTELGAIVPSPAGALPPVQGLVMKGEVLSGFVDVPSALSAQLLQASGSVRGVFVRPWLGAADAFPLPPGFSATSHRVLWARVTRFSDIVFAGLRAAQVDFAGLICPRKRGEVGVRVASAAENSALCQYIQGAFGGHVKAPPATGRRVTLRASGVPLAMLDKLALLVARVDPALRMLEHRVVRTTGGRFGGGRQGPRRRCVAPVRPGHVDCGPQAAASPPSDSRSARAGSLCPSLARAAAPPHGHGAGVLGGDGAGFRSRPYAGGYRGARVWRAERWNGLVWGVSFNNGGAVYGCCTPGGC